LSGCDTFLPSNWVLWPVYDHGWNRFDESISAVINRLQIWLLWYLALKNPRRFCT
jgi:hypothetical protein